MLRRLKQTRQRYRLQLLLTSFAGSLAALVSVGALLLLALRFISGWSALVAAPVLVFGAVPRAVLLAAGLLALAFSCWRAWRYTPTLLETARRADLHFRLGERLSTSLETAEPEEAASELLAALQADAEAAADRVIPAAIAPLKLPAALGWWLAGSLLAGALLQLRQADGFLLLPTPSRVATTDSSSAAALADSAALQNELLSQLLDQLPDELPERGIAEGQAGESAQRRDGQQPDPQQAGAADPQQATREATAGDPDATTATRVDQARDAAAAQPAEADSAAPPGQAAANAAPAETSARNDGSTNPSYGPDATRDQELREQARRQQQRAGNPGAGGGDQAALADSSVAGDATASFEGNEAGVVPDTAEQGGELSLPDQVNIKGDRIEVELPPEVRTTLPTDPAPDTISWSKQTGMSLLGGREELRAGDRELLQRYHALVREGNAQADSQQGTP